MASTLELSGVAFITGGASGIGQACARAFAREGVRAIVLADLNPEGLATAKAEVESVAVNPQFQCHTVQTNCAKNEDCQNAVKEAVEKFGRIDYAVNCACAARLKNYASGITKPRTKIDAYTDKDYHDVMDVNLHGVFFSMRAEIQQMKQQEPIISPSHATMQLAGQRGSIVNIASVMGLNGISSACAYVAAKHGVVGLTKNGAAEWSEHLIRVNAVAPGFIMTPLMKTPVQFEALKKISELYTPSKRTGLADEVASTVIFQSSPRSSFVNGATWTCDGGYDCL